MKRYATHDYDSVLELYYAKARFYDAHDRHFTAVDPILDPSQYDLREYVQNPVQFVQYLYVENMPIIALDPLGQYLILKIRDEDNNILGYEIVPENEMNVWYNFLSAIPTMKWVQVFIQQEKGIVGGTGQASIDMLTLVSDADGLVAGTISHMATTELSVWESISPTVGAVAGWITISIFIYGAFKEVVGTLNRITQDEIMCQILGDTGYGLVYDNLTSATIVSSTITDWIDEQLSFFEEPFIKLVCGGGSKQTGKMVGMPPYFPTYWEISSKAQYLSAEEYAEYIDDILFTYETYLPMAFRYPDDPNSYERLNEVEQERRMRIARDTLKQSNMQYTYQSQIKSIGKRIKENLESAI